jgi:exosome complex protein LRP1
MDANLTPLIDRLEVQIDDLRDALEPLLVIALSHSAAKLPLLDKAKLYVLVTYAIESLLFCAYGSFPGVIYKSLT